MISALELLVRRLVCSGCSLDEETMDDEEEEASSSMEPTESTL